MVPKISVLVYCFDEVSNIKQLIANISFAHEIILITTSSNDEIKAIATEFSAAIIQQTTADKKKQEELIAVKGDWVMVLDINEFLSEELKNEIFTKISDPKTFDFYYIKQTLFFFKRKIKRGKFHSQKKIFIYNKKKYVSSEHIKTNSFKFPFSKSNILTNRIDSYSYKSFDEYNHQLSVKSKEEATILFQKNVKPNIYHFFAKPFSNFIKEYFVNLGFLDGKEGYILAYINSFAVLKRYLILWLMRNKMD